jgi:hypothetical protein
MKTLVQVLVTGVMALFSYTTTAEQGTVLVVQADGSHDTSRIADTAPATYSDLCIIEGVFARLAYEVIRTDQQDPTVVKATIGSMLDAYQKPGLATEKARKTFLDIIDKAQTTTLPSGAEYAASIADACADATDASVQAATHVTPTATGK